jgi:hypothetical protein
LKYNVRNINKALDLLVTIRRRFGGQCKRVRLPDGEVHRAANGDICSVKGDPQYAVAILRDQFLNIEFARRRRADQPQGIGCRRDMKSSRSVVGRD